MEGWEENTDAATAMNNLAGAMVYTKGTNGEIARNAVRAEKLLQECGRTREKVLGTRHPDTLTTVMNLGCALQNLHRLKDAQTCYKAALEGFEVVLGADSTEAHVARENIKQVEDEMMGEPSR